MVTLRTPIGQYRTPPSAAAKCIPLGSTYPEAFKGPSAIRQRVGPIAC